MRRGGERGREPTLGVRRPPAGAKHRACAPRRAALSHSNRVRAGRVRTPVLLGLQANRTWTHLAAAAVQLCHRTGQLCASGALCTAPLSSQAVQRRPPCLLLARAIDGGAARW